MVDIQEGATAV